MRTQSGRGRRAKRYSQVELRVTVALMRTVLFSIYPLFSTILYSTAKKGSVRGRNVHSIQHKRLEDSSEGV